MTTQATLDPTGAPAGTPTGPVRRAAGRERGEGVISTAIAVLIIAFLGVGMWAGFNTIFKDATATTSEQVQLIGR